MATHNIVEDGPGRGELAAGKTQKWVNKKRVNASVKVCNGCMGVGFNEERKEVTRDSISSRSRWAEVGRAAEYYAYIPAKWWWCMNGRTCSNMQFRQ